VLLHHRLAHHQVVLPLGKLEHLQHLTPVHRNTRRSASWLEDRAETW
jgi:hypothetical protein